MLSRPLLIYACIILVAFVSVGCARCSIQASRMHSTRAFKFSVEAHETQALTIHIWIVGDAITCEQDSTLQAHGELLIIVSDVVPIESSEFGAIVLVATIDRGRTWTTIGVAPPKTPAVFRLGLGKMSTEGSATSPTWFAIALSGVRENLRHGDFAVVFQ